MHEKRRRDIAAERKHNQEVALLATAIAAAQSGDDSSRQFLHELQNPERVDRRSQPQPTLPQPGLFSLFDIMPVEPTVVRVAQES